MADIEDALVVRLEASLSRFERQMVKARKAARTSALDMEGRFDQMGKRMATSAQRGAAGLSRVVNVSGAGRFVLQNTAANLGDIAVQMEMGTNPARVMSQQLPQILGGFGALGGVLGIVAPLLGTIAAVGIPAVAMFWNMADGAEGAAEKVKTFEEKLAAAEGALSRAEKAMQTASAGGLDDLLKKYGEVTDAVRDLAQELLDIEVRAAKLEVGNVISSALGPEFKAQMDAIFGGIGSAIIAPQPEDIEAAKAAVREIQTEIDTLTANRQAVPFALTEDLRLAKEELAALQGDFANAADLIGQMKLAPELAQQIADAERGLRAAVEAGDFRGVADGIAEMRRLIDEAGVSMDQGVRNQLVQAEDKARELAGSLDDSKVAAEDIANVDMAGGISTAVDEAAKLAENFGIALSLAQKIAMTGYNNTIKGGRSAGRGGPTFQELYDNVPAVQLAYQPGGSAGVPLPKAKTGSRRSGRSSGKAFDALESGQRQIEQMQRQIEMLGKTDQQVAALTAKYQALDAAKRAGVNVDTTLAASGKTLREEIEAQAESFGNLTVEYDKAKRQMQELENFQGTLKDAILDMAAGGENAMQRLGQAIKRAALQALLLNEGPLAGVLGGKSGGGGLWGGVIKAVFPSFDGGGYTGSGSRSGGVDGKGGFFSVLHPNETVIDHTKGQQGGTVRVIIEEGPMFASRVRTEATGVSVQVSSATAKAQQQRLGGNLSAYQERGTT